MKEYFISYVNSHITTPLTDREIELVKSSLIPTKLKRKQYLLQQSQVCKYTAFIVKGALRQYSVDDKGTEHTVTLSIENSWVVEPVSYETSTPSLYNIEAWEDTEMLLISKTDVIDRMGSIPALNELAIRLHESYAISSQKRLNTIISFSAEKRFADFANSYPELLERFPQHIIASYLGIAKETLSRIRK